MTAVRLRPSGVSRSPTPDNLKMGGGGVSGADGADGAAADGDMAGLTGPALAVLDFEEPNRNGFLVDGRSGPLRCPRSFVACAFNSSAVVSRVAVVRCASGATAFDGAL